MPEVTLKDDNSAYPIPEGEVVLAALERGGNKSVRVGCRKGGCGACRVKVLSGAYTTLKMSRAHVTKQEEREGYALACRILAKEDLVIEPAFRGPRPRAEN